MKSTSASLTRPHDAPRWLGPLCAVISAIAYTAANICLRSVTGYDPYWVTAVKVTPTALFAAPWLLASRVRNNSVFPSAKILLVLALAAVFGQLGGNVAFQWSLGVIGLAATVPLTLGSMIVSGAIFGRTLLGEPVTPRAAAATVILIGAMVILSVGGPPPSGQLADAAGALERVQGAAAACLAGASYALLGVAIRYGVTRGSTTTATVFIVAVVGVVSLGGISWARIGGDLWKTPSGAFLTMVQAGLYNAVAFFALTKALRYATVFYVNAVNATQVAMAAAAGVIFFHESFTWSIRIGVLLTMAGMVVMNNRRTEKKAGRGM